MTATEFRALLKARNHSSFSAAPLIGTSPAHIRSWASGRQNIPTKYLPAIEKLPDRPPGKRWSPAEIGRPAEAKPAPDPGSSLPRVTTPALGRRKRRRERPLPVFDPVAYDKRHPIRPVKDGPAPTILDLVAYARALPEPWRPADDPSLIAPVFAARGRDRGRDFASDTVNAAAGDHFANAAAGGSPALHSAAAGCDRPLPRLLAR